MQQMRKYVHGTDGKIQVSTHNDSPLDPPTTPRKMKEGEEEPARSIYFFQVRYQK